MTCALCHRLPASIDALCPDCFWLSSIKPRLELRQNLLDSMSQNETELKAALERIAPVGRLADGSYRSVLHKCVCGHSETSWLALHMHLQASGVGHGYILHGQPIAPKRRTTSREASDSPDSWSEALEGELL